MPEGGEAWLGWEEHGVRRPHPALTRSLPQTIMEQFNPSLRTFIAMGKNYEKALAGKAIPSPAGGGRASPGPHGSPAPGQARKVRLGARGGGSERGRPPGCSGPLL